MADAPRRVHARVPRFTCASNVYRARIFSLSFTSFPHQNSLYPLYNVARIYKCGQEIIVIAPRGPLFSRSPDALDASLPVYPGSYASTLNVARRDDDTSSDERRLSRNLPRHRNRWHYVPVCDATRRILSKVTIEISCARTIFMRENYERFL